MNLEDRILALERENNETQGALSAVISLCFALIHSHPAKAELGLAFTYLLGVQQKRAAVLGMSECHMAALRDLIGRFHEALTEANPTDLAAATEVIRRLDCPDGSSSTGNTE